MNKTLSAIGMIALLFSLGSRCWALGGSGGGSEVGNGGDAVLRDGRLIVRDLIEDDIYKKPFVGNETDPEFAAVLAGDHRLDAIGVNKALLGRKLTDLERFSPGLGIILLKGLEQFSFLQLPMHLMPLANQDWMDDKDPRTQVVVRYLVLIVMDPTAWKALDELNQVALLIHEAFYSYVRPNCLGDRCFQWGGFARILTNDSFRTDHRDELRDYVSQKLDLVSPSQFCSLPEMDLTLSLWIQPSTAQTRPVAAPLTSLHIVGNDKESALADAIQQICGAGSVRTGELLFIATSGYRNLLQLRWRYYLDSESNQTSFYSAVQNVRFDFEIPNATQESCVTELQRDLRPMQFPDRVSGVSHDRFCPFN